MHSPSLIRWSGLAAVLGGTLLLVSDFLNLTVVSGELAEVATTGAFLADGGTRLVAIMLLLVGLVGLYAHQSGASGILGLVGFLAAFAGTSLTLGAAWTNTFVPPWRQRLPGFSGVTPPVRSGSGSHSRSRSPLWAGWCSG